MNIRTIAIAAALVVALTVGYLAFKQHSDRSEVAALVKDTGTRLRETLALEAGPATALGPETTKKLDAHAAAAERNREALKRLGSAGDQARADAADNYLLTGQEILRRQAAAHRNRLLLADSVRVLREHFRADRGAGTWVKQAVQLRQPVEKYYGSYRTSVETLDQLLESLPAAQSRIAPLVPDMPLAGEKIVADARQGAQASLKRASADVESFRRAVR